MLKKQNLYKYLIVIIAITPLLSPIRTDLGWLNASPVTFKTIWAMIGLMIGLIWWLYSQYQSKKFEIVTTSLYMPILSFLAWSYISLLWVEDGYLAITTLVQYTVSVLVFFLVINVFENTKKIDRILIGLIVSMVLVSILGLFQYYLTDNYLVQNLFPQFAEPSATFGNRNMASHFLVMTLPLSISYVFIAKTRLSVILMAISVFIGFWYVMYISARQAYLALLIELIFLCVFFLIDNLKNKEDSYLNKLNLIKFKSYALLVIVFSLFIMSNFTNKGWDFSTSSKFNRVQSINMEGGSSRIPAWVNTIELIKDNPIIGVGVGQWSQTYPLYYDRVEKDVIFNEKLRLKRLHNDYLEIFSNAGIIGFLILISLAFLSIKLIFNTLKDYKNLYRMQMLGLSMGLVGFLIVSFFSFPARVFLPIFLVFVFLAIVYLLHCAQDESIIVDKLTKNIQTPVKLSLYFLPIFLIFLFITSYKWVMAEYHHFNAQSLLSRERPEMAASAAMQAINQNHWPANYYFIAGSSLLISGVNSQNSKSIQRSILFLKKAIDISPFSTPILLQLARAYRVQGGALSIEMERKVLEFVLSFDPKNVNALAALTKNLAEIKRGRDAFIVFERLKIAFEYFKERPNFGPYHFSVGYVATKVGDYKYARYVYNDAVDRFPTAENYLLLASLEFDYLNNKELAITLFKKALLLDPINIKNKFINSLILDYESNVK